MTEPDLAKEVTEFLAGERAPFHFDANVLSYLIVDEARNNAMWPKATMPQWKAAIEEAIKRGLIEVKNHKLAVVVKTKPVDEDAPIQMGLF